MFSNRKEQFMTGDLTLYSNVKLTSSHFAKSGIHRRFFLEIAMENNSYRHLDYTNTTHMVSLLNLLSLLL